MGCALEPLYVRYQVPDLARAEAFLRDFGMQPAGGDRERLFLRGHGDAPWIYEAVRGAEARFLGAGFRMSGEADLVELSALEGSGPLQGVDAPGGGKRVRMRMGD